MIIYIFNSELQEMCRNAIEWGRDQLETGNNCYGWQDSAGDIVIAIVAKPGPNSVHRFGQYIEDLDHFRTCNDELSRRFRLRYHGRSHSHHIIKLQSPSPGDEDSGRSIMMKNNLSYFVEIIITIGGSGCAAIVQVNPYLYSLRNGVIVAHPAELRVLPGISPIRRALAGSRLISTHDYYSAQIPEHRIHIRQPTRNDADETLKLPEDLERQVERLPKTVRSTIRGQISGNVIVIQLSLSTDIVARIGYLRDHDSIAVKSVHLGKPASSEDITGEIDSRSNPSLNSIFEELQLYTQSIAIATKGAESRPPELILSTTDNVDDNGRQSYDNEEPAWSTRSALPKKRRKIRIRHAVRSGLRWLGKRRAQRSPSLRGDFMNNDDRNINGGD